MREKRRPTLEELREMPVELWALELSQLAIDAEDAGVVDVQREALEILRSDPDIVPLTPEKVVELRVRLQCATAQVVEASVAI